MITSLLISTFASALYLVFQFIPTVTSAPSWWVDNVYPALSVFSGLSGFPIIGTLLQMAVIAGSILLGWQGIVFANWLYNKIRGSG